MPTPSLTKKLARKSRGPVLTLLIALASFAAGDILGGATPAEAHGILPAHARSRCLSSFAKG
jgi:hypothetical protein